MSSALVRQALELVDPEESVRGRGKKAKSRSSLGQEIGRPLKNKRKQKQPEKHSRTDEVTDNIRKLLALSQHTTDPNITKKIVARCAAGKPVSQKTASKKVEEKSILFPDDEPEARPEPDS
ncbi:hypothetical protein MSG28_012554 [Choristoneura fumiferana]|uniref:Uncharacterized protein n=1 Tax=Choristoneura fumiferana TaxID=7141 RepID=A0ACC0JH16_CHOFU|nr:hypothetical protein MSG28_012554 [Choristoneura fumiferana]